MFLTGLTKYAGHLRGYTCKPKECRGIYLAHLIQTLDNTVTEVLLRFYDTSKQRSLHHYTARVP